MGLSMAGFHLGNVAGLLLTPIMLSSIGITGPFILFSSLGLLWLTMWTNGVTNDPRENYFISKSELRLIQAGKADSPVNDGKLPPISLLLSKLPTWAIILANVTNNWVSCFSLIYSFSVLNFHNFYEESNVPFYRDTSFFSHGCLFISRLYVIVSSFSTLYTAILCMKYV